jgi:hypothetical protein
MLTMLDKNGADGPLARARTAIAEAADAGSGQPGPPSQPRA